MSARRASHSSVKYMGPSTPSLEKIREINDERKAGLHDYNIIPVFRELLADLETPVSAFLKLKRGPYSFLFESVEGGENVARYSFIGTQPYKVIKTGKGRDFEGEPLCHVESELALYRSYPMPSLPTFTGGAVGYVGYDCVKYFEPKVNRDLPDPLDVPEALFMFCNSIVIFDHVRHTIKLVSHVRLDAVHAGAEGMEREYRQALARLDELAENLAGSYPAPSDTVPISEAEHSDSLRKYEEMKENNKQWYMKVVDVMKEHIVAGDVIQAVPSQRLARPTNIPPFDIYRSLRVVNPSPYMFYLDLEDFYIVGASPELLVKVEEGRVITHPIAGTRRRGVTKEQDEELAAELLADEKERAEHIMLVDLGRNDLGRISEPGTVRVDSLMHIEKYSHVMHIVSNVSGQLAKDKTVFDAFRSVFPAGTVSGAPKVRAMQIISDNEPFCRRIYAGAVGYWSFGGVMDTCIALRTMIIKDRVAYLQAGAGIVYDSDPLSEFNETVSKMGALARAVDLAEELFEQDAVKSRTKW
eukprot:GILK01007496.1.p1 GENE.GILK01007496.1~~GILK01007496.1.p1  ORF type:complete len:527 (-),score=94.96 GILK01007496.1:39-1619(-)